MTSSKATFKVSEDFVIGMLYRYYIGDNSLKNPLKMFKDEEAITSEMLKDLDVQLQKQDEFAARVFLSIDAWFNDLTLGNILQHRDTLLRLLSHDLSGYRFSKILLENFYEADLNYSAFSYILAADDIEAYIFRIIGDKKILGRSNKETLIHSLLLHDNFPLDLKIKYGEQLNTTTYLPQRIREVFIF